MSKKEIFICDVCKTENVPWYGANRFIFEDEKNTNREFNKFTLEINREVDSVNGIDTPCMCLKCLLKYLEMAVAQTKGHLLITGQLVNDEVPNLERWKPKEREIYFSVDTIFGETACITNLNEHEDILRYDIGNCFKSKEEAERALEKVKKTLLNFHKENE
jgi:hypothetical protein